MRVRILQGKHTGSVVDVGQSEGEHMLSTGFAALAPAVAPPIAARVEPAADPGPPEAEGGSLADEDDPVAEDPQADRVPGRLRAPRQTPADPSSRRKRR